jgi:hypothetical protein
MIRKADSLKKVTAQKESSVQSLHSAHYKNDKNDSLCSTPMIS